MRDGGGKERGEERRRGGRSGRRLGTPYLLSVTCLCSGMLLASLCTATWLLKSLFLDEVRILTMMAMVIITAMKKKPTQ